MNPPATSLAYLGPAATFTQEALLTQRDLARTDLTALSSITAVLDAVAQGAADLGSCPLRTGSKGRSAPPSTG